MVRHIGGQPITAQEVWMRLLRSAGLWPVLGLGYWIVETHTGGFVGEVGFADFHRTLEPPFGDVPEAGWAISPAMQGRGYAREALDAAHAWLDGARRVRAVCMIRPANLRSIRLAAALGYRAYAEAAFAGEPTRLFERQPAAG